MHTLLKPIGWPLAVALAAATVGSIPAAAPAQTSARAGGIVQVATNRGRLITLSKPMSDLFVANSEIADVQVRSPTQLYVFGKKTGETTISATTKSGAIVYSATIRVGNNYDSVGAMLKLAMPEADLTATTMNGVVLLTGTTRSPEEAAEAQELVQAFVGEGTRVLSRLRTATPLQVNLQVRIAEVARSYSKNLGVNVQTVDGTGGFKFGVAQGASASQYTPGGAVAVGNGITGRGYSIIQKGVGTTLGLGGGLFGLDILGSLDLGETIGQVSTLANPNLTALSGETATFLAGGEIPIPISQGLGAVSVEFKQYGISLAYTPTVLSNGSISLRVRPEVSQLSSDGAVTLNRTTIPALTTRRAETTLILGSGQSMVIGGLLQNSQNNTVDKTPGLGDLPILGALFRSNSWRRNETELVIVITPYLVKPVDANAIALPTDGLKAPTDLARNFLGQVADGTTGGDRPKPMLVPPAPAVPAGSEPLPPAAMDMPQARNGRSGDAMPGFGD
ncbi:type II and III secretion system protein family protein [Sphingomonas sp.]|jgi:pilus assembly protein CpaC|uniref:type II and III secretion system protein family protein n=1 Tax=Sphingomonas sp. TaxID=28214 RepID=UPI0035C8634E